MGLAISVGMLADLLVNDEEGAAWMQEDLAKLNGVLAKAGLAPHVEPTETDIFSCGTYGYSGLHYLRRCAAHLDYAGQLPGEEQGGDPIQDAYYARYSAEFSEENETIALGDFARPSQRGFDHLIMHSDAEGFYIPQRFEQVLIAGEQAYGWVGSSYTLLAECERLAAALNLPSGLLADGEDLEFGKAISAAQKSKSGGLFAGLFRPKRNDDLWRTHPIASMMCAKLHNAASHSVRTGAAMVFC